jgi:Pyruvate/2-oxoacid:ferredoxin oxidoreductase delta subunit
MGKAVIMYMTGTGNTARAAGLIEEELERAGWAVAASEIRRDAEPAAEAAVQGADLFVLCFPVLGFGMPALVRSRLGRLRGAGRRAAVFATWGGEGTAALWQARWFLRLRGYRVAASGGASYPFQWTQVFSPQSGEEATAAIKTGDAETKAFAKALASGTSGGTASASGRLARALGLILGLPVSWLYRSIGRHGLGAMYAADERCRACQTCVRGCPAGAMTIAGQGTARRPRWRASCQGCNRCINLCPRAAIQVSPLRAVVHLALNTVLIVGVVVGLNHAASAAAAAWALPAAIRVPAYVIVFIALTVILSRVQFTGLEPVLFALESAPPIRGLIGKSWTARFPRYRAPGFRPAARGPTNGPSGSTQSSGPDGS